ncbi:formate hydrogenlyase regulator HycA [Mangrovibacter phragmitis]|uniref:formate hydrogenlyase regulator HycA n=1 Tax=Mangrovibacter phragmitis TaxID=1691903 RepID=UPI003369C4C5
MTIWELSEKAEYIADRHRQLQDQWHTYCNTLIQAVTLSKAHLYHAVGCSPDEDLCFVLFDHFIVHIEPATGFNCHTIEYTLSTRDDNTRLLIGTAELNNAGQIDNTVNIRDRQQVLDHYLGKIGSVYDSLYQAVHDDTPLNMSELKQELARHALA